MRGGKKEPPKRVSLRVCLTGGWYSSQNVGDNAILKGICDSFEPPCEASFTVFSSSPERVQEGHGLRAVAPKRSPFKLLGAVSSADALLFTGGTPFYDETVHMGYFASLAAWARLARVPVAVFGISLRTLETSMCRKLTRFICNTASYVAAREPRSVRRLSDLLDGKKRVDLLPDPATQMKPITKEEAERELAALGVPERGRRIAVCLRDFTASRGFSASHYSSSYSREQVTALLAGVARWCEHVVDKHGVRLVFFPMNTNVPDDDRVPAHTIEKQLVNRECQKNLHIVDVQFTPRQMKGLLGCMDMTLGVRFHSLVLSASMNVPTYALGYAPKNEAIMEFFGREQYAQSIASFDEGRLIKDADAIFQEAEMQRAALRRRNAEIDRLYAEQMEAFWARLDLSNGRDCA